MYFGSEREVDARTAVALTLIGCLTAANPRTYDLVGAHHRLQRLAIPHSLIDSTCFGQAPVRGHEQACSGLAHCAKDWG